MTAMPNRGQAARGPVAAVRSRWAAVRDPHRAGAAVGRAGHRLLPVRFTDQQELRGRPEGRHHREPVGAAMADGDLDAPELHLMRKRSACSTLAR